MNNFICPLCKESLELRNRSLFCENRHCFDLAKEGYVNLLPVNSKKSKDPGDNSKMMAARRSFLESGHYKPLADKLVEIIENIPGHEEMTILDIGCGEGYYTGHLKDHIQSLNMLGLDISKVAVRYASKKYRDVNFCVASAFDLPVADSAIDIILRVFAPSSVSELHRVVKNGRYFIAVIPGERHLYQLRDIIYSDVHIDLNEPAALDGFDVQESIKLKYSLNLSDFETVMLLLDMTPFGWKITESKKEQLRKMESFTIDCDFHIEIFKKVK
ncbi:MULTISPECIES: 23S rRNA (guanine(745)-N(1))-methyltransferase [unclassified Oceanispirochaeta]|uniref:23S rRNA (guanine(745)-N(1))-methyltransferase n=1 Tax=unclassified Oceanispirochaeta TaxID=2635722 RepID=UPI000E09CCE6|nr:23S rRNA (guanine(745)-N(1))-methyltransferase [Oceanispirochaeta sp. M1]MBF9015110.1 23S rRNA (guanine(745)-N(1))-methyltransferase [Oceanispirochaeta sp. M2]NPD71568.1 23S rRNA (guanine(745)-N(1))-methyltransferase [Oceanispirochaeta sp. M1]RDG33225.1 23S rRNA (guanine(745)-N(1))-methyltransferase [Oceanispirochaeta sp. M1]